MTGITVHVTSHYVRKRDATGGIKNQEMLRTWDDNEMAVEEWFRMFMRKNPELAVRTAQATSLSREISFNWNNINAIYDNLATVMDGNKFEL